MAKQRRAASKSAARSKTAKAAAKKTAKTAKRAKKSTKAASKRAGTSRAPKKTPVVNIRQAYAKAVALYEKGVKAMQRKNYAAAASTFQQLLAEYPEERELHERAKLYLNVCERQAQPKEKAPRTVDARKLAATVALNRRDVDEALSLLKGAASNHPDDDHLQYMLALAHALRDDAAASATHLTRAIELNPDNRIQARQEPDFDAVRDAEPFETLLTEP